MKRWISFLLACVLVLGMAPIPQAAAEDTETVSNAAEELTVSGTSTAETDDALFVLPQGLQEVGEEAFEGNTALRNVVVPRSVEVIGARAFAGCSGLRQVSLAYPELQIADDAFDGIGSDVVFYAHENTKTMTWVLTHGYVCESLDGESDKLAAFQNLLAEGGFEKGIEQGAGTYASKCLIIRNLDGTSRLPDISAYHPTDVFKSSGNLYYVQFDTEADTENCWTMLNNMPGYRVEVDMIIGMTEDDVGAAGVTIASNWGTKDVMGFDEYAPYVNNRASGNVSIAVIDTGFGGGAWGGAIRNGISLVGGSYNSDSKYHGTKVASVIWDCLGVAGSHATLIPIKAITNNNNDNKATRTSVLIEALNHAADNGADIINMSFGWEKGISYEFNEQIQNLLSRGILVVGAAGNDGGSVLYPANISGVTTVSALTYSQSKGYKVSGSTGPEVDFTAPGHYLQTTSMGALDGAGDVQGMASTSFAAPQITAALALIRMDSTKPGSALDTLISCCDDLATEGLQSSAYGYGLPKLDRLVIIRPTSIEVTNSSGGEIPQTMWVGDQFLMNWKVLPEDATDKTVTITVDDSDVIKMQQFGPSALITALASGDAVITLSCGSATKQIQLHVEQPVTKIVITGAQEQLILGKTMQLSVQLSPENAGNKAVTWTVSDDKVASVSDTGLVTPVSAGKVRVTCEAEDGYGTKASVEIEVIEIPDVEKLNLKATERDISAGTITMQVGEILTLIPEVLPEKAPQDVTYRVFPDNGTITMEGSLLMAKAPGVVTLIATAGKIAEYLQITVEVAPVSVSISGAKEWLDIGEEMQLFATVSPSNATNKNVFWSSSNPAAASVNPETGLVTAVAPGDAQITCTSAADETVTSSFQLTVRQPITVSFDPQGGECETEELTAYSGYALGNLPTPTRTYYAFVGWYTAEEGGVLVTSVSKLKADSTLYAHWNGNPYQVTLDANGGTVNGEVQTTMQGEVGSRLGALPNPERTYYNFLGWYTETGGALEVTSDYIQETDQNLALYAHWQPRTGAFYFNANGGYCDVKSVDVPVDSTIGTLPTPTRSYYIFDGWFTAQSGGEKVTEAYTRTTTNSVTLYAHWTPMEYTVKFYANGGTCWISTKKVKVDAKLGALETPTRPYYTFLGWHLADGTPVTEDYSKSDTTTITLTAYWEANPYTVSFDACGGTVGVPSKECRVDSAIGTLPTPTRKYYDFLGWYTDGDALITETKVKSDDKDLTLYAHWKPHTYTLTFNANGGECSVSTRIVSVDEAIGNLPNVSKSNYTFDGWYTAPSGGTKVSSTYSKSDDSNMTLYAHLSPSPFTLTFNANGGTCSETSRTCYVDAVIGTLPTPTRSYYTFAGWYTAASGGTQVTASNLYSTASNVTIYAHWTPMEYTMKFDLNGSTSFASGGGVMTGKVDTAIGTLPVPTSRTGYDFAGWYTAVSGGSKINESYKHTTTNTITVYARWTVKGFSATWSNPANGSISVSRTSSPLAGAATGALTSGATVYYNDVLSVTYSASTGYSFATKGSTSITVTSNIGSSSIYATTTANNYTYNIVNKSTNGTQLSTSTVTKAFGSSYSISPAAITGYTAPAAQNVAWDSTNAKTITFEYTPVTVNMTPSLASGRWWNYSSSTYIDYAVSAQIQNRTETSVQIRFVWKNTISKGAYYGYQQHFTAKVGSVDYGATQIITNSTWSKTNRGSNPPAASKTVYSDWKTIPVSATTTSVSVSGTWYDANYKGNWSATFAIPTY